MLQQGLPLLIPRFPQLLLPVANTFESGTHTNREGRPPKHRYSSAHAQRGYQAFGKPRVQSTRKENLRRVGAPRRGCLSLAYGRTADEATVSYVSQARKARAGPVRGSGKRESGRKELHGVLFSWFRIERTKSQEWRSPG